MISRRPTAAGRAARAATALAVLGAAAWLPACSLLEDEPERDEEGNIAEEGDLSAFSMEVGDCLVDLDSLGSVVSDVPVVPCDEPHEAEVFETFDLPDGDIPDPAALEEQADQGCNEAFEPYFGAPLDPTTTLVTWLTPSTQSWDEGDREVVCISVDIAAMAESTTSAPA